jgi:hypothetical protein
MLTSSMLIGLAGIVLTAALMAADWYVWEPRYRGLSAAAPELSHRAEGSGSVRPRGIAGGQRVASFAPQTAPANVLARPAQSGWMRHCPQS